MRKILIVDDEPHLSQELRCMLGAMCNDWNIDYSNNGPDALRRLESEDVDVIVSEMRMSGMDGKELLTQVREKYPEMVRIVLSAFFRSQSNYAHRAPGPPIYFKTMRC